MWANTRFAPTMAWRKRHSSQLPKLLIMNLDLSGQKAIAVVSGGLDSVTLAHLLHHQGAQLHLLAFDYGQKHRKELEFARECATRER